MRRILFFGSAPTVGDAGIGLAILQELREMYPDARLDIATGTPADYQAMKLGSNVGVRHKPMLSRGATDPVRFIRRLWQIRSDRLAGGARDEFDSYFRGADLVVFQGGPAWNDVFLHGGKIKEMLLRMQACQSAGAMVVLWGQSFGPFAWRGLGGLVKRRLIKQALNRVNLIAARDLFSLPALARIGVKRPTMIRAADAATRLRVSDEARAESLRHWSDAGLSPTATTLGVCLRDLRNRYGLTDETFETFCDQIAVGLDRAVDDFEQLVFCSTDYRHGRKLCSDLEVFEQVAAKMRRPEAVHVVREKIPADVLAAFYGKCNVLLAGRLHPAIFAVGQGTPVAILAYSAKCFDFAKRVGLEASCVAPDRLNADEMTRQLVNLRDLSDELRQSMDDGMRELRAAAGQTVDATLHLSRQRGIA